MASTKEYLDFIIRLPGNGAGVTCVKSRNERRGYENNVAGTSKIKT